MLSNMFRTAINALQPPSRTKLALIVRSDLKMTKGKTAAQCAHAAVLCYQESQKCKDKKLTVAAWTITGQPKIVLCVENYKEMVALRDQAKKAGLVATIVTDAGHTQLSPGTATVLGVGPDTVDEIDKLAAHLKLL